MLKTRCFSFLLVLVTIVVFIACEDAESDIQVDFRDGWVGSYEGTKSGLSFEDSVFAAPVSLEITRDQDSSDGLIVNGITFPITEEGTYGPDFLDGGLINYDLIIVGDELRLASFATFANGDGEPIRCFIIADKI